MTHFVGVDVSVKETSVRVVDDAGKVVCERSRDPSPGPIGTQPRVNNSVRSGLKRSAIVHFSTLIRHSDFHPLRSLADER